MEEENLDPVEFIRKRPGLYMGGTPSFANHMVLELAANGIDQFLAGRATSVRVARGEAGEIIVSDDGPGLPYDQPKSEGLSMAEFYFTHFHDSPTADEHAPHVHLVKLGLGLVAVNALSTLVRVTTWRGGLRWEQSFERGRRLAPPQAVADRAGRGTVVAFTPDAGHLGEAEVTMDWGFLRRRLFDAAHLMPGLRIHLDEECFHAPGGLGTLVDFEAAAESGEGMGGADRRPASFITVETEEMTIHAAMTGTAAKSTRWRSWVNGARTPGHGSHVEGFAAALRAGKWKPGWAVLHIIMKFPRFAGPTRDRLHVTRVRGVVKQALLAWVGECSRLGGEKKH